MSKKKKKSSRKKKNWFKKNSGALIVAGSILILASVLFYFAITMNFAGLFTVELNQEDIDNLEINPSGSCSFNIPESSACTGDLITSTLKDGKNGFCRVAFQYNGGGWTFYGDVNTDSSGLASLTDSAEISGLYTFGAFCIDEDGVLCRTNDETIRINDCSDDEDDTPSEDDTPEVGDSVGIGVDVGGIASAGEGLITDGITIPWTTGGNYVLGVRIQRSWTINNPEECDLPQQYPVEWTLYDSNGLAWHDFDYLPVSGEIDEVCPVTYHPDAPWKFEVNNGFDCEIEYGWSIRPYICEVLD